mmetsp:Transcript_24002/g.47984  ORF Transcript_24002/g.47984 Transcript_24002/m.47984 type:complete len:220 (-) Transcript_24002:103-762(-)
MMQEAATRGWGAGGGGGGGRLAWVHLEVGVHDDHAALERGHLVHVPLALLLLAIARLVALSHALAARRAGLGLAHCLLLQLCDHCLDAPHHALTHSLLGDGNPLLLSRLGQRRPLLLDGLDLGFALLGPQLRLGLHERSPLFGLGVSFLGPRGHQRLHRRRCCLLGGGRLTTCRHRQRRTSLLVHTRWVEGHHEGLVGRRGPWRLRRHDQRMLTLTLTF